MKKYYILQGLLLSGLITLLLSIGRLVRLGDQPASELFLFAGVMFTHLVLSWIFLQAVFHAWNHGKESLVRQWWRGLVGIVGAILLSYAREDLYQIIAPHSYIAEDLELARKRVMLLPAVKGMATGIFQYFVIYYLAMTQRVQKAKIEIEQLKKEHLETRLHLLKQQLSPHFLFNSLNTLKTMVAETDARQYIVQLSHVYRYLLNHNDNSLASLKDEIEFTDSYLAILKERFEAALIVNTTIPEHALSAQLPPLALQILIENAIKHNVVSEEEPLTINITYNGNKLEVANNLNRRISVSEQTGTGLQNIMERYRLLSRETPETHISSSNFIVRLPLIEP
ncbi:MAG: histidine kinase [Taibaiella sp.]|nr:histidine kinase [Taibaiella sp.]